MKRTLVVISVLAVIFFIFIAAKNIIIRTILEKGIKDGLGVKINMQDLDVSLLSGHLRIEGLTIENPAGFEKKEFIYIPLVNIICDPFEYLKHRKLYIYLLDLNIERINIIKNKDGIVNLSKFPGIERKQYTSPSRFSVEIFKLTLNDVYYIEYSHHNKPVVRRYSVDIKDMAFGNIDRFDDVIKLVVLKVLSQTEIGKLVNISIIPLANDLKDIVLVSGKAVKDVIKGVFGIFGLPFSGTQNK